jgi:hypothetical protein
MLPESGSLHQRKEKISGLGLAFTRQQRGSKRFMAENYFL